MISEPYFWDRNRIIDFQTPQVLQFQPISTDHVSYIETFYKTTTLKFDQHHLFLPSISTFASTLFFFFKYYHHFHVVNCDWLSIIFTCTQFFFHLTLLYYSYGKKLRNFLQSQTFSFIYRGQSKHIMKPISTLIAHNFVTPLMRQITSGKNEFFKVTRQY